MITEKDKIRFEKHFDKKNGCWEWEGATLPLGYGIFRYKGKNWLSHRFSYLLYKGEIPEDMCVCHSCDNKKCIAPQHLWLGTYKDNMQDMVKKGRHRGNTGQKLIEETKLKISLAIKGKKKKPLSEEQKKKLSLINTGKKHTEEAKKKMSLAQKLRKPTSKETRKKLSLAHIGNKIWLGKKHSEESKKKMSKIMKGNKNWLGKKHTEETKKKMSEARKKYHANK